MLEKYIKKYIDDNSSYLIQGRSVYFQPKFELINGRSLFFSCIGTTGNAYNLSIHFPVVGTVLSKCNCAYDKPGICKHRVAALDELLRLIKRGELVLNFEIEPELQRDTKIPVINGVLSLFEVRNMPFSREPYYGVKIEIKSIAPTQVQFLYNDFSEHVEIGLHYNPDQDELLAACTCQAKRACFHKSKSIEKLVDVFGIDYFSPRFISNIKLETLREHKYSEDTPFDDFFELNISVKGVTVKEKFKNIIQSNQNAIDFLGLDNIISLPATDNVKEPIGVALCLEFYKNLIQSIYPIKGKLSKDGTELSTKLRSIDRLELLSYKNELQSQKDFNFVTQCLLCHKDFRYNDSWMTNDKSFFVSMHKDFQPLLRMLREGYPVYTYQYRASLVKKNITQLRIASEKLRPIAKIHINARFFNIQMKLRIDGRLYDIKSNKIKLTPVGVVFDSTLYPFPDAHTSFIFAKAYQQEELNIVNDGTVDVKTSLIDPMSKFFRVEHTEMKEKKLKTLPTKPEKQVYLSDENGDYIVIRPMLLYGEQLVEPLSEEKLWADQNKLLYLPRDSEEEEQLTSLVAELHPDFEYQNTYFYLTPEKAMIGFWLMDAIDKMQEAGIKIFGLNSLKKTPYNLNKPTFQIRLSSNTDWFDMELDISFGEQKADLRDIQKAVLKRSNFVELKDGTLGVLPKEWIEKYRKYFKLGQVKKNQIEISNFQFNLIDELYENLNSAPSFLKDMYEKKKRLANLKKIAAVPKPTLLKADLRPYQQEGLNWMVFLHENQLGGCLADDMGLGKTLQTIAFLQHLKNNSGKEKQLQLVVAPTSLMFNWQAEFKKFAPKLKVLTYVGANREELQKNYAHQDVILTTYGTLINDVEFHQKQSYQYIVLDESQAIKNPESQRYKSVRLLKSWNRLVLTGTPIENNTFDLYSQFNFLNPGFFGSVKHFRTTFSDAIDKEQSQEMSLLLAKMINPFILRRTKTEVATELPPKTEAVVYCDMGSEQRKVYEYYKQYFRDQIQKQIEEEGINKSQIYILQGLTKLRQICNSTELADPEKDLGEHSAKMDQLVRHLKEKVTNHKVLVFSQFVGMLQIIKKRLEQENILFEYLDGQTRKREEKVNNFQNDESIRVFLISLKAGGTGLNLTEADYVYLVDPWWNPAVENQAIDRCYRIGQNKSVMAYRMICNDTIEEKIVQLQERKKTVASEVIRVDLDKKSFNLKEIEHLFA